MRRSETTPVPMVTENHDGEKFRTTLRHPTSYFVVVGVVGPGDDGVGGDRDGRLTKVSDPPDGSDEVWIFGC